MACSVAAAVTGHADLWWLDPQAAALGVRMGLAGGTLSLVTWGVLGEAGVMKYKVVLVRSEEGVSASVPGLPGCWSQGESEDEALQNIRAAIGEYLSVVEEQTRGADVREVEVAS